MKTSPFSALSFLAPETTQFSGNRRGVAGATVQRWCNGGALHLMALKGLGKVTAASVQR